MLFLIKLLNYVLYQNNIISQKKEAARDPAQVRGKDNSQDDSCVAAHKGPGEQWTPRGNFPGGEMELGDYSRLE